MVGIPQKRDFEKEVYDFVRAEGKSTSIKNMAMSLRMRPNNVSMALENLSKNGLIEKHNDDAYPYYLAKEDPSESYLSHVDDSIHFYQKILERQRKTFSRNKIFIDTKIEKLPEGGTITSYKINPKIKAEFETYLHTVDIVVALASKLRLSLIMEMIPKRKSYIEDVEQLETRIYKLAAKAIKQIEDDHGKEIKFLKSCLKSRVSILKHQ